ncbi:NIPSNAP family protein [Rossellomorea sp. NPDC077527]|uniref:NIPSNAP family protein n=1 Tax=Rossellomorea sp. NPDC077527 TaxID=3364510 RepID=UPI0037C68707
MVYRVRTYEIIPNVVPQFNHFFHEYLLPNQLLHGAELIGRWVNEKRTKITAIWKYESMEHYKQIEECIKRTSLHQLAQTHRSTIEPLYISTNEEYWSMTGNYDFKGLE